MWSGRRPAREAKWTHRQEGDRMNRRKKAEAPAGVGLRLLSPEEVAAVLGAGRSKVYQMMDDGELPYVKLGRSRRVTMAAVEKLVERNTVGG
jgi:excisionase family DNA binding protein